MVRNDFTAKDCFSGTNDCTCRIWWESRTQGKKEQDKNLVFKTGLVSEEVIKNDFDASVRFQFSYHNEIRDDM